MFMEKATINLVCYEDPHKWILGKFVLKLQEELLRMGIPCNVGPNPDEAAEINHHVNYFPFSGRKSTTETLMVTHIDSESKLERLKRQLCVAEMGVCMSAETVRVLAGHKIPELKLCFINPAHDNIMRPRKIAIGIASRVYADGRKREGMLLELARGKSISPDDFCFHIMGEGWNGIVSELRDRSFEVVYFKDFDPQAYTEFIPNLDYYLYLGLDEGSMGFVDALSAGVRTIVPAHGFHIDAPKGITHQFIDSAQLKNVFAEIVRERRARQDAVASWTWPEYARKHVAMWEYVLARKAGCVVSRTLSTTLESIGIRASSEEGVSGGNSTAIPPHLGFRNGRIDEQLEFMEFLFGVGAKGSAALLALKLVIMQPLDKKVWRHVAPHCSSFFRLLRNSLLRRSRC